MTLPDDPILLPIARSARSVVAPGPRPGRAARGATRMVDRLGVAQANEQEGGVSVSLPWGVWPRAAEEDGAIPGLEGALASYAAALRRKKAPQRRPAKRGLPLLVRRAGGTQQGPRRGPGGLAMASRPEDLTVASPPGLGGGARRPAPLAPGGPAPASPQRPPTPRRAR